MPVQGCPPKRAPDEDETLDLPPTRIHPSSLHFSDFENVRSLHSWQYSQAKSKISSVPGIPQCAGTHATKHLAKHPVRPPSCRESPTGSDKPTDCDAEPILRKLPGLRLAF